MKTDRTSLARRGSIVGIIGNGILALLKILTGFLTGSVAILADGIDSSTDILTSFITLASTVVSSKPPDAQHPYGHERADAVASKVVSMIIFFAGAQLALSSLEKLFGASSSLDNLPLVVAVALVSSVGKYILYRYKLDVARKIESSVFLADAMNMRMDIIISLSVLGGAIIISFTGIRAIDTLIGLAVSVLVLKTAIGLFWETNYELMDGLKAGDDIYNVIFQAVSKVPGVQNPHKVRVRKMGYKYLVDLDIEVDPTFTVRKAHLLAKEVEKAIMNDHDRVYDVHVHIEPSGNVEEENYGLDSAEQFASKTKAED